MCARHAKDADSNDSLDTAWQIGRSDCLPFHSHHWCVLVLPGAAALGLNLKKECLIPLCCRPAAAADSFCRVHYLSPFLLNEFMINSKRASQAKRATLSILIHSYSSSCLPSLRFASLPAAGRPAVPLHRMAPTFNTNHGQYHTNGAPTKFNPIYFSASCHVYVVWLLYNLYGFHHHGWYGVSVRAFLMNASCVR
eukprot:981471_1